jgi:hypothetical protein
LQLALHLLAMAGMLPNGTLPSVDRLAAMLLCGLGFATWRPLRPLRSGSNLEKPRIV